MYAFLGFKSNPIRSPKFMIYLCFLCHTIQGLGTSTDEEAKEYFRDLEKHKKDFVWEGDEDGEAIELAFSKKKIEARKNWLRQFEVRSWMSIVCFPQLDYYYCHGQNCCDLSKAFIFLICSLAHSLMILTNTSRIVTLFIRS